jgi:acyl-ACP thioesterase
MKISSIQNQLQDIAWEHASLLKVSVKELFPKNLTWVLVKLHILVHEYPLWENEVKIRTWPRGSNRMKAFREFQIFDSEGNCMVSATSSWMILNFKTRRPVSVEEYLQRINPITMKAIDSGFSVISEMSTRKYTTGVKVRYQDLDINQHANNVSYIDWCIEPLPETYWKNYQLREFEISYLAEAFYGDSIFSTAFRYDKGDEKIFLHDLNHQSDEKELAKAKSRWSKFQKTSFKK